MESARFVSCLRFSAFDIASIRKEYTTRIVENITDEVQIGSSRNHELKLTDNILLVGNNDASRSSLEMYSYNASQNSLTIYQRQQLESNPLCIRWINYDPESSISGNMCAVGLKNEAVTVYNLENDDLSEPALILRPDSLNEVNSHGGVLDLSWNKNAPNTLASGSNNNVFIWDLNEGTRQTTIEAFQERVHRLQYHHSEPQYLLTGSSGGIIKLFDCRSPNVTANQWINKNEVGCVDWDPNRRYNFFYGLSNGFVSYCDSRYGGKSIWRKKLHDDSITGISLTDLHKDILTTTSLDGIIKVWQFNSCKIDLICQRLGDVGNVLCSDVCRNESVMCAVGGNSQESQLNVIEIKINQLRANTSSCFLDDLRNFDIDSSLVSISDISSLVKSKRIKLSESDVDSFNSDIDHRTPDINPSSSTSSVQSQSEEFAERALALFLKNKISYVCLEDMMTLVNNAPGVKIQMPTGKVQLLKMFSKVQADMIFFTKCSSCKAITQNSGKKFEQKTCSNCSKDLESSENNYFIYMPIKNRIEQSIKLNWPDIQANFESNKNGTISDVHDARILQQLYEKYRSTETNVLSLSMNIDGANYYKSNQMSMWPIQLVQSYLPPSRRYDKNNIIVAGLYYGDSKPDCLEYCAPLVNELKSLQHNFIIEIGGDKYQFYPVLTHCIVDLPARSMIQQITQFNGEYACPFCLHPGTKIKSSRMTYYPVGEKEYELRSPADTLETMLKVTNLKRAFVGPKSQLDKIRIKGIKGLSCLVSLKDFDIINGISFDYMHAILSGVTSKMLDSYLDSSNHKYAFYINKNQQELLNKRILSIKPIREITRRPRSLEDRANYKANEIRSMLLFYLPICLEGILSKEHLYHFMLLSSSVYTMLKPSISLNELDNAKDKLKEFVAKHETIFGRTKSTMNVHMLEHAVTSVKYLGPLWAQSAFTYESNNGHMFKYVHGTRDLIYQIATKLLLQNSIPKRGQISQAGTIRLLGSFQISKENGIVRHIYSRLEIDSIVFTSIKYMLPKKTIDYFVGFKNGEKGTVEFYFKENDTIYALVQKYLIKRNNYHITEVKRTDVQMVIEVKDIEKKYIFINMVINSEEKSFIVCPPNNIEKD